MVTFLKWEKRLSKFIRINSHICNSQIILALVFPKLFEIELFLLGTQLLQLYWDQDFELTRFPKVEYPYPQENLFAARDMHHYVELFPRLHSKLIQFFDIYVYINFYKIFSTVTFDSITHNYLDTIRWTPLRGHHYVDTIRWTTLRGHHYVGTITWTPLRGYHQVATIRWTLLGGHHYVYTIRWTPLRGDH